MDSREKLYNLKASALSDSFKSINNYDTKIDHSVCQAHLLFMAVTNALLLRPKICCLLENLAVDYFAFTALHSADEFSNEQRIFGLIF